MRIGVLALQGDFEEHCICLKKLGVKALEIRLPSQLEDLDGLIIPGGESTTIGKLATDYNLVDPIRTLSISSAIWGTCGGLVFLATDVGRNQPTLGLIDMVVERNAFGRQIESFEEDLTITGIPGGPFRGIFIRAPRVQKVGSGVDILCELKDGSIVAVRHGKLLATSFHPELTNDTRIHEYFLSIAAKKTHV
ncbi:MAG: pyridoxal 5'-phosphate synthase glutaminase subunit PdxT [Desulfomonilaceae bacterium]